MARDKQLIVRLENEEREKFKQFCQDNQLEMSSFLYELVRRFNNGSLTLDQIMTSTASGLDSEGIDSLKKSLMAEVDAKIEAAIANLNHEMISPLKEDGTGAPGAPPKEVGEMISPTKEGGLNHKAISELYSQEGKPKALATVRGWANPENKDKPRTTPDKRFTYDPKLKLWFETKEVNKDDY